MGARPRALATYNPPNPPPTITTRCDGAVWDFTGCWMPAGGSAMLLGRRGAIPFRVLAPLQTQFPSTITLPYDNTNGFVMGVALANLSSASANVTATMWDANGNQLGTQSITIAGNGHTSFALPTELSDRK